MVSRGLNHQHQSLTPTSPEPTQTSFSQPRFVNPIAGVTRFRGGAVSRRKPSVGTVCDRIESEWLTHDNGG